jgi:hypothetical protein
VHGNLDDKVSKGTHWSSVLAWADYKRLDRLRHNMLRMAPVHQVDRTLGNNQHLEARSKRLNQFQHHSS